MMWGSGVPASRPMRRLLARCTSRKLRCWPPSRQKGLSALTTPAPWVQRLPAPPASVTTADLACGQRVHAQLVQRARCASGRSARCRSHRPPRTSSILLRTGSRFWARPMRPPRRSARICSCCTRSKPCSASSSLSELLAGRGGSRPGAAAGRRASAPCPTAPAGCGRPRQSASSSARREGESAARSGAQQLRHGQRVVARRHERVVAAAAARPRVPCSLMAKS